MSGDFQVGEWCIQPAVNRVIHDDRVVRLEPKVMQVLVCLAEQAGDVVTREALLARVWPDVHVTDDVLHRAVRELRRVFGDSPSAPRYIETIRKRGYRLIPAASSLAVEPTPKAVASALCPDADAPTPRVDTEGRRVEAADTTRGGWRFSLLAAVVALTVAAGVLAVATRSDDLTPQANARFVPIVSGPFNESDPAVSPDGRRIAFVQSEPTETASADIYLRDLDSGQVRRLTDDPASDRMPVWAPDASRLAFVRVTPAACDIFVRPLTANTDTRIAACPNRDEPRLAWTGDGRALLTSQAPAPDGGASARLVRLDLATGVSTPLTAPPPGIVGDQSPAVAPDGRRVAFIRRVSGGVADIYLSSIEGADLRRVTFDEADLTGLDWTGDGRSLVYSSDRAGGYSLWRIAAAGGTPSLLAGGAARMKHPAADRANRRVVYENWNYEINVWQAGRVNAAITRTSELWNLYPQVSPDGTRIAYVSTQSGAHELWVADRDGAHAEQLTRASGGTVKAPRWSPDGRRVVYLARGQNAVDVHFVDVSTGLVTRVTSSEVNEVAPAWSGDGTRILFGAPDGEGRWHVWSAGVTDGETRLEIADAVAAQAAPDGSMYFTRSHQPGLWRTRGGTAAPERVLEYIASGNTLGWVLSGTFIYFLEERGGTVVVRRSSHDGDALTAVASLSRFTWPGFSVAPDGTVLYARWDRRDSNLMSIEY